MGEKVEEKTVRLIMAGMMTGLITMCTVIFRIPIPFSTGYIHLGDSMIFLTVLILGRKYGAAAAGIGSALADVVGGFAMWAPWTFGIKAFMAVLTGYVIMKRMGGDQERFGFHRCQFAGMILPGAWMVSGYYIAEGVIYGNFVIAAMSIPWNLVQFGVGFIIAGVIAVALAKTPVKKYFKYT